MLEFTTAGKVKISMYDYIDKMLMELPIDMNGHLRIPECLNKSIMRFSNWVSQK